MPSKGDEKVSETGRKATFFPSPADFRRWLEQLDEPYRGTFRKDRAAWAFFQAQPPSYRRAAIGWVISAKKEETRLKRLGQLIAESARGQRVSQFTRKKPSG